MEDICIGQRLKKIPIVLGIPEEDILRLCKTIIPNCTLESRVSPDQFDLLRPELLGYLQRLLENLRETIEVERKKKKKRRNYKPSIYNKTSKYNDFVRIIYTNM